MLLYFSETYHGSHCMTPTGLSGQIRGLSYELSVSLQLTSDTHCRLANPPPPLPPTLLTAVSNPFYLLFLTAEKIFSPFNQTHLYISSKSPSIQSHKPSASTQKQHQHKQNLFLSSRVWWQDVKWSCDIKVVVLDAQHWYPPLDNNNHTFTQITSFDPNNLSSTPPPPPVVRLQS